MHAWYRRLAVAASAGALCAALATLHLFAQSPAPPPAGVLGSVYFRPLTVFSRGGRVTAVAGVPADQQIYYMGGAGGVWKTTDAGAVWEPMTDGQIGVGSIGAIAVAESNPERHLRRHRHRPSPRGNVSNGDGVYKSTDAGKTWQHIGLAKAGLIGRIRIHPQNPDIAYVAVARQHLRPEQGARRLPHEGRRQDVGRRCCTVSDRTGAVDLSMDVEESRTCSSRRCGRCARTPWSIDSGSMEGGLFRTTDGGDHWHEARRAACRRA